MKDDNADLKAQLLEARAKIERQLQVVGSPIVQGGAYRAGRGPPDNRGVIAELRQELTQIDECLKGLDSP